MNKILLYTLLFLIIQLTGCKAMGDHFNCLAEVDRMVPAQTQQKFVRTDTKCVKSNEQTVTGAFGSTWGTVYNPAKGDVSCSSVPIYETIVTNQAQRDDAYQQCRNGISSQRSEPLVQTSYSGTYVPATPSSSIAATQIRKSHELLAANSSSSNAKVNSSSGYKISGKPIASALSIKQYQEIYDIYLYADSCAIPTLSHDYPQRAEVRKTNNAAFNATSCYGADKAGGFIYFAGGGFAATLPISLFGISQQVNTSLQPKLTPPPIIPNSHIPSMEEAKVKCIELGFKIGTESFGQCVLKASK